MTRVLALDYGRARCGCAISDPSGTLADPLPAVERPPTRVGLAALERLVNERQADRVIVGLPLTLAGEEGRQAEETKAFAERLQRRLDVPVELYDERLTTRQAERTGREAGSRASPDSIAAAHLLETYLASRQAGGANSAA